MNEFHYYLFSKQLKINKISIWNKTGFIIYYHLQLPKLNLKLIYAAHITVLKLFPLTNRTYCRLNAAAGDVCKLRFDTLYQRDKGILYDLALLTTQRYNYYSL